MPITNNFESYSTDLFVGRERELEALKSAFFEENARLVMITGKAGLGKTSLAAMFVKKYQDKFPGGVHWIEAHIDPLGLGTSVAPLYNLLHLKLDANLNSLAVCEELHRYANEQPSIIESRLDMILRSSPNLQVLCTSQAKLNWKNIDKNIELRPFSKEEFAEIFKRRLLITNIENLDELYRKISGSPLSVVTASSAVHDKFISLEELQDYTKPFKRFGILGPDGKPLNLKDDKYQNVISTVHGVNREFLKRLSDRPSLLYELSPRQFEELVAELLDRRGYEVTLTPASRDGGVDIYAAEKKDIGQFLYLVQCKKFKPERHVGVGVIRELIGALELKKATAGILVTTSFFTKDAYELQQKLAYRISLQDYLGIQKWIKEGFNP
ncbi:MAG TPA: restriction endonuclease [Dehalococcoidales bacterium]|nr:restriction endonuclease [Dehalococcoidales bacterium]